jgi:hypothetical protein
VVTGTNLGSLWVAGNMLPSANEDQYSTVGAPLNVPVAQRVTTWPASELGFRVLPTVGTKYRTSADTSLINELAARFPNPAPSVSIADASVSEGSSGFSFVNFTVSLSGAFSSSVSVSFATSNGTALAGSDYEASGGTLIIPAGASSATISVAVRGDAVFEPNETFGVTLSAPVNATLADAAAVGTILNDDAQGFSVEDVKVVEPTSGTTTVTFTVTLAPTVGSATTVNYATANGTAVAPGDYAAASGTLSFPANTATRPVAITVNGDGVREGAGQTFTLNLSSPTGGPAIARAQATARIFDPGTFFTVTPCRLVDTRNPAGLRGGPALTANVVRTFGLATFCGIPSTARALSLNVTITGPTGAGNLRVFPGGGAVPLASSINYAPGQTRANSGTFAVNTSGQLAVRADGAGTVHLILDVNGYYQ